MTSLDCHEEITAESLCKRTLVYCHVHMCGIAKQTTVCLNLDLCVYGTTDNIRVRERHRSERVNTNLYLHAMGRRCMTSVCRCCLRWRVLLLMLLLLWQTLLPGVS